MKLMRHVNQGLAVASVAVAMSFTGASVRADAIEDIYSGETVTIIIGHPPGGSYDLYAQLAAAHLGKHIAGEPNVIVQHMPGGGGRKGAAFFINNTDADGKTIAILPDTLGHTELLDPSRADWKSDDFRYIGRFAPANAAFVMRKDAPATTIEEMRETEIVVACTGKGSRSGQQPTAIANLAGLKLKVICGYQGSKPAKLATLRGETDMTSENWASLAQDTTDLDSGDLKVMFQAGLVRDPGIPEVPLLFELTDDPEAQAVLRFISAGAPIGRSIMIHPDTSEEVIAVLRAAFQSMLADPEFLADAQKRGAIIDPETGEYVEGMMQEMMSASPEMIAAAMSAMDDSGSAEVAQ
jgi:tripartite-type tricarboxylate transporter receptor subunit TctC